MAAGNRKNPERCFSSDSRYSLMEFMAEFPDDEPCLQWLWKTRLSPDGEHALCPKCKVQRAFKRYATNQQRQSWTCVACGHHLHPTAGTIFHKSSTSLHLWFYAMYMITSTRCGISAKQLGRELGVTYKTAWRIFNRIRYSLYDDHTPLNGHVEMDETLIGGKDENRHVGKRIGHQAHFKGKTAVFGMVQRGGKVVARVVPTPPKSGDLLSHIRHHVMPATTVFTDEARFYQGLNTMGYDHGRVHHTANIYVSGQAHTNTIEGFLVACEARNFRRLSQRISEAFTVVLGRVRLALQPQRRSARPLQSFGFSRCACFAGGGEDFAILVRLRMKSLRLGMGISMRCFGSILSCRRVR